MFNKHNYEIIADSEFITIGFESEKIGEKQAESTPIVNETKDEEPSSFVYWFVQLENSYSWQSTTTEESQIKCWEKCLSEDGCVAVTYQTRSGNCMTFSEGTFANVVSKINQDYVTLALSSQHESLKRKISSFTSRYG